MKLVCLGLNHETAPVEVRERFALTPKAVERELEFLQSNDAISESVVLSTCNRTEYYAVVEDRTPFSRIEEWICKQRGFSGPREGLFYHSEQQAAAEHLCRVSAGMNSMVLGETEIFGQVKKAYQIAHMHKTTGGVLNRLFQKTFGVVKKVRNSTGIQIGSTSVASASVELAEQVFGSLTDSTVIVVGAGEMARKAAQALKSRGAKAVVVTNRSYDKAVELAESVDGRAVKFDQWEDELVHADIIISSTGAPHYVLQPRHIEGVRRKRKFRSLIAIDIAVPRDIDPAINEIEEVYLYDIDVLQKLADDARHRREQELLRCDKIIKEELEKAQLPLSTPPQGYPPLEGQTA